jgi:hypothetical protein
VPLLLVAWGNPKEERWMEARIIYVRSNVSNGFRRQLSGAGGGRSEGLVEWEWLGLFVCLGCPLMAGWRPATVLM